jgi:glycosyltransferase involved in cell wall biosynthesis
VIICAQNEERLIGDQLTALSAQDCDAEWELIVVDNGSSDATTDRVLLFSECIPRLRVIDASERCGAGYARNVGAAAADGQYLFFIDADDRVAPGWLQAMVDASGGFDALCGNVRRFRVEPDGTEVFEGVAYKELPDHGYDFLPSFFGGNFGMRADVFRELGGFDVPYDQTKSGEDIELSWRLVRNRYSLGFVSNAMVHWRSRAGLQTLVRQAHRDSASAPQLYRQFRGVGMRRSSTREALLWWVRAPRRIVREGRSSAGRRNLARELGWRTGRIVGSVKARTFYL